ncbi:cell division protein ZipA C-terminal FtsZ-binding domain-containing protein [Candidatus Thiosymbion oneisti]|uniref:cell division protein ZipA C-terminal FtsZ-binding domain-containing protein n=1 Tax=Candidatus Thiosymbion oneisti TaxID=589554 RepID=UPI000B23588F|nr:cell division protein ZipA C-terminal FtsZ-binding domain-containing protein [Candidatus Thiosymbion oneisti]
MDADTLRLLLIVAGGLVLGGLYIWERRRARSDKEGPYERSEPDDDKREPWLDTGTDEAGDKSDGTAAGDDARERSGPPLPPDQSELELEPPVVADRRGPVRPKSPMVLSLHIIPKEGSFDGETIVRAAGRCGVEPGEMEIFHCYADAESTEHPVFSMANMVKPGTFPFGAMDEFESPGLTLFSQVEGAPDDPSRLEAMLTAAHCLADALKAEIRIGSRESLTPESEERLRDRVHELMAWRLTDPDPQ